MLVWKWKKYKSCHMGFDEKIKEFKAKGFEVPHHSLIKTPEQIENKSKCKNK